MPDKSSSKRASSRPVSGAKRQMTKKAAANKTTKLNRSVATGIGLPKRLISTLKYSDTIRLESTAGAIKNHQFILNGLYDTDFTGVGHQPMYFDQLMGIYNHYTVVGCKLVVRYQAYDENIVPVKVGLWQNDDTTITPADFNSAVEQSKGQQELVGNGGEGQKTLTMKWSAKQTFGPPMANTLLRGSASANPTEQSVGVITVQSADVITTTQTIVQVELEFITVFTELKDITGS